VDEVNRKEDREEGSADNVTGMDRANSVNGDQRNERGAEPQVDAEKDHATSL
jgi:hypothetical protein